MSSTTNISEAIADYAKAYKALQDIQISSSLIPEGDQKTGCIGEYYAYCYLLKQYTPEQLRYGSHSEKAWDIAATKDGSKIKYQVKTVSAYAKFRKLSPVHEGFETLLVIYLNEDLKPEGFWVIESSELTFPEHGAIHLTCPDPERTNSGSQIFKKRANQVELLSPLSPKKVVEEFDTKPQK